MKYINDPDPQYTRECTSIPQCEPFIPDRNFEDILVHNTKSKTPKPQKIHIHSSDLDKMLCSLGLGKCANNCEQYYQNIIMIITIIVAFYLLYRRV